MSSVSSQENQKKKNDSPPPKKPVFVKKRIGGCEWIWGLEINSRMWLMMMVISALEKYRSL